MRENKEQIPLKDRCVNEWVSLDNDHSVSYTNITERPRDDIMIETEYHSNDSIIRPSCPIETEYHSNDSIFRHSCP